MNEHYKKSSPRMGGAAHLAGALLLSAAYCLPAASLAAQDAASYPTHSISLVVPYAAGGGVDTVGRVVAHGLSEQLKQSVVVENRSGAGSNLGSAYVAKSAPDGYTLLVASPATAVNVSLYKHMPFDPRKDLRAVTLIGQVPSVMIVNKQLPVKNLHDFIALAKKEPGKLSFGSGGNGASEHLAGEMLKATAGIDIMHVPYRGGAAATADLLGGRISSIIINQITALPLIQSGKVRALAVAGKTRSPSLPDVPTFAEQGYPDYLVSVWWGIMAPSRTPDAVVDKLNRGIQDVLRMPETKKRLGAMGVQIDAEDPAQFAAFLANETQRWGRIVKSSVQQID